MRRTPDLLERVSLILLIFGLVLLALFWWDVFQKGSDCHGGPCWNPTEDVR